MSDISGLLGLASVSRNISFGDTMIQDIRSKKCKFVVIAEDASDNTKKKILDKCAYYGIEHGYIDHSEVLSKAIGKANVKAIGILDKGFADKINKRLKG